MKNFVNTSMLGAMGCGYIIHLAWSFNVLFKLLGDLVGEYDMILAVLGSLIFPIGTINGNFVLFTDLISK